MPVKTLLLLHPAGRNAIEVLFGPSLTGHGQRERQHWAGSGSKSFAGHPAFRFTAQSVSGLSMDSSPGYGFLIDIYEHFDRLPFS